MTTTRSALALALLAGTLSTPSCGKEAPMPSPPAAPPAAADTASPAPAPPDASPAPAAPPPVWTATLTPEPVRADAHSSAALRAVAADGLTAHIDAARGVLFAGQDQAPVWLDAKALATAAAPFDAAIKRAAASARCQQGECLLQDADRRWLVRVRTRADRTRFVAGVFDAGVTALGASYDDWQDALAAPWAEATAGLVGEVLGDEEAGNFNRALTVLDRLRALDPENPWALYYRARVKSQLDDGDRDAFADLVRLANSQQPGALAGLERALVDAELAAIRARPVAQQLLAEVRATAPTDPSAFVSYLTRFRRSPGRLQAATLGDTPTWEDTARLLRRWHFTSPDVDAAALRVTWRMGDVSEGLQLARRDDGSLALKALILQPDR